MTLKDLVSQWERNANGQLTDKTYEIKLTVDDAAKVAALAEMYPRRSEDQILSELVSAALVELEKSFPYKQGANVISIDELGDPIYEDIGPTPAFLDLKKKYFGKMASGG